MRLLPSLSIFTLFLLLTGCGSADPVCQGQPVSYWIKQLEEAEGTERAKIIALLQVADPAVIPRLDVALEHTEPKVRSGAAFALLQMQDAGLQPVVRVLNEGKANEQMSMARVMCTSNVRADLGVAKLIELYNSGGWKMRHWASMALSEIGPDATTAVPALAVGLSNENVDIRWRCAYALLRIGKGAQDAVPELMQAVADADPRVRVGAIYTLGTIGEPARQAADLLHETLQDPAPEVRWRAAQVLRDWGFQVESDADALAAGAKEQAPDQSQQPTADRLGS